MKKFCITFCLVAVIVSCGTQDQTADKSNSTIVSVIIDPTDTKILWPTAAPVLTLFECNKHPEAACSFSLSVITDKKINPSFTSIISDGSVTEKNNINDDAQFRKRLIVNFYTSVKQNFDDAYRLVDTGNAMAYSECWNGINTELCLLNSTNYEKKFLIIASDLMENSDILNSYKVCGHETIAKVAATLTNALPLPRELKGLKIFIVFEPRTRAEDKNFYFMLEVYKAMLEPRGATVQAVTNNKNYIGE